MNFKKPKKMSVETLVMSGSAGREMLITWREDRSLAGTCTVRVCRQTGHGSISRVYVRPGFRRDGLGSALIRAAKGELRAAGSHRCFVLLHPHEQRTEVRAFFEFHHFEVIPGSEFDPPLGSLVMMCELDCGAICSGIENVKLEFSN